MLTLTGQAHFQSDDLAGANLSLSMLYASEMTAMKANAARRTEFLSGRNAAAVALADAGFHRANTCYIGRDSFGAPQWPTGWIGSITHSKGTYIAIAAKTADYLSIGVDIEMFRGDDMDTAIARICMVEDDDATALPTLIFSAKEAIYKACHPLIGGNLWFTDFTVTQANEDGTFAWQFNPNPAINGHGQFQVTDTGVLTCVALNHDHIIARLYPQAVQAPQKEFA
jgi:4'-phosphopantetheinyl transferase EntD